MSNSLILVVVLLFGAAQADVTDRVAQLYETCNTAGQHCYKPRADCGETRSCDFLVQITPDGDEGKYAVTVAATIENQYVAVGLNAANNSMSPAITVYCINNGESSPRAALGVNPEGHQHLISEEENDAFMIVGTAFGNGTMLCDTMFHSAITLNNVTVDLANEKYFLIVALGQVQDGVPQYHSDKYRSDEAIDFN